MSLIHKAGSGEKPTIGQELLRSLRKNGGVDLYDQCGGAHLPFILPASWISAPRLLQSGDVDLFNFESKHRFLVSGGTAVTDLRYQQIQLDR